MNTKKLLYATCLAAFAVAFPPVEKLVAQSADGNSDDLLQLVINYQQINEARSISHGGALQPVSLAPNSSLPFTLEVPRNKAGYPVMVASFDGGQINAIVHRSEVPLSGTGTPLNLTVSDEGTVDFSFKSGSTTGLYRVLVTVGVEHYRLQFYVIDPNWPGRSQH